jgi:hypothetical protein
MANQPFDPAAAPAAVEIDTETMTAADAKERLEAVTSSRDFGKRLMGGDKLAAKTLDFLQRRSLDMPDAPAPPTEAEQTLNRDVPDSPGGYYVSLGDKTSEADIADSNTILAAAHDFGLTRGAVESVITFAQNDIRNGKPCDFDSCEARLKEIWKGDFEENNRIYGQALRELGAKHPKLIETLEKFPASNNSPALAVELVHHAKLRQALRK